MEKYLIILLIICIPCLIILIRDIIDQDSFDDYPFPLKFAIKEVENEWGTSYKLYYKRLLFWHPYTYSPAIYCEMTFEGTYEECILKAKAITENRKYQREYQKKNRWWKHKIKEIKTDEN